MKRRTPDPLSTLWVVLLLVLAPAAFAQRPDRPSVERGHGPGGHDGPRGLFEFLDLSEEQREAWGAAHRSHFESLKPTIDKIRDVREQLRGELEGEAPDAATVGGFVIAIHQLDDEMEASRGELDAAILEILTDEQEEKLEAYKAANPDRHRGRGPGGPPHGGPRHGGPGFGGPSPGGGSG